jgi:hypothetical protein
VTFNGRGVRLYLWKKYLKIIDINLFPISLIDDYKYSGRVALQRNDCLWRN